MADRTHRFNESFGEGRILFPCLSVEIQFLLRTAYNLLTNNTTFHEENLLRAFSVGFIAYTVIRFELEIYKRYLTL